MMCAKRQLDATQFMAMHEVFTLDQAVAALSPDGVRSRMRARVRERLRYHVEEGGLRMVERELYAVVPPGVDPASMSVDPFEAAHALRPEGVFAQHAALELLGAAHSVWNRVTVWTGSRRRALNLGRSTVRFPRHPKPLRDGGDVNFATRTIEHRGAVLRVTGAERTLVEGFRDLNEVGGPEELLESAMGFASLDLDLLERVLSCYGLRSLYSCAGWFLERHADRFGVSEAVLDRFASRGLQANQYMERNRRGGALAKRWRLIVPDSVAMVGGLP